MKPSHKHEFAVDAACDCGLMISEIMQDLENKWSSAEDEITRLIAQYDAQNLHIEKLRQRISEFEATTSTRDNSADLTADFVRRESHKRG